MKELSDKVMEFAQEYAKRLAKEGIVSSYWMSSVGDYEPNAPEQRKSAPCISVGLQVNSKEEGAFEELKRRAQLIVPSSYEVVAGGAKFSLPVYFMPRGKPRPLPLRVNFQG